MVYLENPIQRIRLIQKPKLLIIIIVIVGFIRPPIPLPLSPEIVIEFEPVTSKRVGSGGPITSGR